MEITLSLDFKNFGVIFLKKVIRRWDMKRKWKMGKRVGWVLAVFLYPAVVFSHHALEYLDVESYSIAGKKEAIFYLRHDYFVDDKSDASLDHWEFTPGISYGILKRVMFDIHIHLSKFGSGHIEEGQEASPFFEALAPSVIIQLTGYKQLPVDIALSLCYEYPFHRSRKLIGGTHTFEGKFILSRDFGVHSNITLNAGGSVDENGDYEIVWMLGAKTPLTSQAHGIAAGIEIEGTHTEEEHAFIFLPGIYFPVLQNIRLKAGLGAGFTLNEKTIWTEKMAVQLMYIF